MGSSGGENGLNRHEVKREGGRLDAERDRGLGRCRATRIGRALRVETTRGPGRGLRAGGDLNNKGANWDNLQNR